MHDENTVLQLPLAFINEAPPRFQKATSNTTSDSDCVIFSCSSPNYYLVDSSWRASKTELCDRYHFYGRVVHRRPHTDATEVVASNWCRVALLDDPRGLLAKHYTTVIYVDVDVVFDEAALVRTAQVTTAKGKDWSVSFKKERAGIHQTNQMRARRRPGVKYFYRTLRTCSLVLPNLTHVRPMIQNWARHYRDVDMQDQTVLNELYSCLDDTVLCWDIGKQNHMARQIYGELKHCGSWWENQQRRINCLESATSHSLRPE